MEEGDGEMRTVVEKLKGQLDMLPGAIIITVQRKDLEMLIHELEEKTEEWSNQSCLGYVIQGLNDAGLDGAEGRELVRYVQRAADSKTLKQATSIFKKSRI
ncbi:hypothetical protein DVB69_04280 [Sporosarcina sp. BI001-red]|uniref:hypothetical protein n=1 Tax=Sporosarcina sp. BI001-red TaxID=2282866 RepID=UPI000E266CD4|nr:hypothetical protein [Sporosarcina sp. BI001-red]REB10030.1 hypothetical protein DVB69_04280 [Sporosarcina sp. BI001-red]